MNGLIDGSGVADEDLQMILEEIFLAQDHAAQRAALAVDIFGRGMHDDMGAELHRPLQRRAGKGIVDDQPRAGAVRDLGDRFQIDDGERRIGRRLQEQDAWSAGVMAGCH